LAVADPPWAIENFSGVLPRFDPMLLPPNAASEAWNCDMEDGDLNGFAQPIPVHTFGASYQKAYRLPSPTAGGADAWLGLPDPNSSVCRSPLADDTEHRVYWTVPGVGAFFSTYADILAGNPPYNLGFIAPDPAAVLTVTAAGGTTDGSVPEVARSYLFTFIDVNGLESSPSQASAVVDGASDGTWTISGLPTVAPSSPAGFRYPAVASVCLYRTVTGATTGAVFYRVIEWAVGSVPATYVDPALDATVVLNLTLATADYLPPPTGLDGLTAFPGGMLIGFTNNTLHFCQPDAPHAWPAGYDLSVQYDIMGLGIWQGSLMVITSGFPFSGSGSTPAAFTVSEIQVAEPCIARGSIIVDLSGVYYASQNGIMKLNYFGAANTTAKIMTRAEWLNTYASGQMQTCRHRNQYISIYPDRNGVGSIIDADAASTFLINEGQNGLGIVQLNAFEGVTDIWNDEYNGLTYLIAGTTVYQWDPVAAGTTDLLYRWTSKVFNLASPTNIGAARVTLTPDIAPAVARSYAPPATDNGDATLQLPAGTACLFRLYINGGISDGRLVYQRALTAERTVFKLPSGYKCFDFQLQILARTPVRKIELAPTARMLDKV
jgi:hypothetical protein